MTKMFLIAAMMCGCVAAGGEGASVEAQAVAGPGGVVVSTPAAGQQAVSWAADSNPTTFKYYLYQSTAGGAFTFLASVLNPSAAPPAPTTYTVAGLAGGTTYCYEIQSAYTDGSTSEMGLAGCGTAGGGAPVGHTLVIGAFEAVAGNATNPGAVMVDGVWTFRNSASYVYFPIELSAASVIDTFALWANKQSGVATEIDAEFISITKRGLQILISAARSTGAAPGDLTLQTTAGSTVIDPEMTYAVRVAEGGPVGMSDTFTDVQINYH